MVFASALSETLIEISQYRKESLYSPEYEYEYGWCFFTAGAAFIMTKVAAVFALSGHLNKYPSIDEMASFLNYIISGNIVCRSINWQVI